MSTPAFVIMLIVSIGVTFYGGYLLWAQSSLEYNSNTTAVTAQPLAADVLNTFESLHGFEKEVNIYEKDTDEREKQGGSLKGFILNSLSNFFR